MNESPAQDLLSAITPYEEEPFRFALDVPPGWGQGRGVFGGIPFGALASALFQAEPDKERQVRAFNADIAGPVVPGKARIDVTELRRGSGLSSYHATLSQEGRGLVHASATLAKDRGTAAAGLFLTPPSLPPWTEVPPIFEAGSGPPVEFARNIEFRPVGALPFSGGKEPLCTGWVRARHPVRELSSALLIALTDAWWPAAFMIADGPFPAGTVSFALQLFPPNEPVDPTAPLCYRGRVVAQQDGYMVEFRELWSPDGRLLTLNQQTIAKIR